MEVKTQTQRGAGFSEAGIKIYYVNNTASENPDKIKKLHL